MYSKLVANRILAPRSAVATKVVSPASRLELKDRHQFYRTKMAAVPGAASGGGGDAVGKKASTKGLRGARRRLSVVSDNKLVEGVASLAEDGGRDKGKAKPAEHIVKTYAGVSRKGYAPYNPRKRNQDSLIMREHAPTTTLFFGVLDGHGEAGDLVSGFFAKRMPKQIFAHPKFSSDPGKAMADEQAKLERELLLGEDRNNCAFKKSLHFSVLPHTMHTLASLCVCCRNSMLFEVDGRLSPRYRFRFGLCILVCAKSCGVACCTPQYFRIREIVPHDSLR